MKITTLIPAYKEKYLYELLAALIQQTVPPDRVIFSDDSSNQIFMELLSAEPLKSLVAHLNVEVIAGPRKGAYANVCHIIRNFSRDTELVHVLCDDDIIYPQFYERHLHAHNHGVFSSTISGRWTANEVGQPLKKGLSVPDFIKYHPNRNISIDSNIIFSSTVGQSRNWLGEVSNTVYRAEFAEKMLTCELNGISYSGLEDLGSFLEGTLALPLCYINEQLGFMRQNSGQNSTQHFGPPLKLAFLAYIALAIAGKRIDKLTEQMVSDTISIVGSNILWHYRNEIDMAEYCKLMPSLIAGSEGAEDQFLNVWKNKSFVV